MVWLAQSEACTLSSGAAFAYAKENIKRRNRQRFLRFISFLSCINYSFCFKL
ncbi:hypothetical protein BFZC1_21153 [Lysinibacillus fusiformis ZC1]|nr:hypothetical protein BFZC1_21153 [Lysinibacillus fusiformis ZC1]